MNKFPLKSPEPDFDNLLEVLAGIKVPDRVLFCEMLIDEEIKQFLIENYFGRKNYPPTVTFGSNSPDVSDGIDYKETKEASEKYYKQLFDLIIIGTICKIRLFFNGEH